MGLQWTPPAYKYSRKEPYIPLEKDVDALIAHCGKKMSTLLQLLKETGARIGEALQVRRVDVDFEQRKVYINDPEKNSDGRSVKVSQKLVGMLESLPRKPDQETIFNPDDNSVRSSFSKQRKRATYKLQNPNLLKIHFHTFRHWKATDEYRKTRNILHVMKLLGHRNINNSLIYTHLVEDTESEDFHFATAKNEVEAQPLIEQGFDYVATTQSGIMLFRKRK